jgi:hypothetical protein
VLAHHGPDVYIESVRAEHDHALYELAHWQVATRKAVSATFNDGSNAIWLLLLSAGALFSVVHRPYRPIVGWCAVLLAIPREGPWMAAIPGSMLIGIGVAEVGGSTLANARQRVTSRRLQPAAAIAAGVVGLLLTYSLFTNSTAAAIRDLVTGEEGLDDATVAAMRWVATETPGDARFVVVSRPQVREWSPQIMRRTVLNSVWGSEWVPQQAKQIGLFDAAVEACEDLPCVLAAATEQFGYEDVYLYIDRAHFVALAEQDTCVGPRIAAFEVLWENDAVTIARSARPGVDSECEPAALSGTTMNPRHPARYRFRDFVTGHYDAVAGIREAPALPTPSILPQ